jgi:hypothetical protein
MRPILSLWRLLIVVGIVMPLLLFHAALAVVFLVPFLGILVAFPLVPMSEVLKFGLPTSLLLISAGAVWLVRSRCGGLLRFLWHIRRFRTVRSGRLVLHYAPELTGVLDLSAALDGYQADLARLSERFGKPLRGRTVVYLFARHGDIARVRGMNVAGLAIPSERAILVGYDGLQEWVRHEFAHLFAARWNMATPPLFFEGLPVWLQETECGQPIDTVARRFLHDRSITVPRLLEHRFFHGEPQRYACYILAGSFCGFLIRHHGWEQFRKLYCIQNGLRYRARLEKCLGQTLEEAERQWRRELILGAVYERRLRGNICF